MQKILSYGFSMVLTVACVFSCFAEGPWFDAGIPRYESWPSGGIDKLVDGAGVWSGTHYAELLGEQGAKSLGVSTPDGVNLAFALANTRPVSSEQVTIRTFVRHSFAELDDEMLQPDEDAKCALTIAKVDGSDVAYFGLAKDPSGDSNIMVRLFGVTPVADVETEVTFELKMENAINLVRYTVGGTVLKDAGENEWLPVLFVGENANRVSSTSYSGDGRIATLTGVTAGDIPTIALTIPAIAHVSVKSVTANGFAVTPVGGVYSIPQGASVSVRFSPETGYVLSASSMSFTAGSTDMELPESGRPRAISLSENIKLNEIIASNGVSLMPKSGVPGIDWVELYNASETEIDLTGFYFGNDPTKKADKWKDWVIKGSCVVPAKGYKILWCDGDGLCSTWAADEAHVACNISTTAGKHTIFLASAADVATIFAQLEMPGMMKDVSYGLGHLEKTLLAVNGDAEYKVGEGAWTAVNGPVGMSVTPVNFKATSYKSKTAVDSLTTARTVLKDRTRWARDPIVTTDIEKIAFRAGNETVNFDPALYSAFPGGNGETVLVIEGSVIVPRSGLWTFAVASDDGFRLELSNPSNLFSMEAPLVRGYAVTDSAFSLEAGAYNLKLIYFDHTSAAALDLSVAEGDLTGQNFSTDNFSLVGLAGSPVQHGGAWAGSLGADVSDEMLGVTDQLAWRGRLTLDQLPAAQEFVQLRVSHSDAMTVKVNGATLASVPGAGSIEDSLFDLAEQLVVGENEIVVETRNRTVENGELFLSAQVFSVNEASSYCYFREPTPNAENTTHGYGPMTPEVSFSELHGYKTAPFELTLSCAEAPDAPIYYTLDGSSPTTRSLRYQGPIQVSSTTCVRAAVPQDNAVLQKDHAATYLYLDEVLAWQPGVIPAGFPADKAVNNHTFRYGMNQSIVNGKDRAFLLDGFTNSIATMSIVIDPKDLFDRGHGIYVNPSGDGKDWERPMILEQFNPVGDQTGFSVPAGLRIRGANSRNPSYAKHSFRVFFRGEYGMGSLEYPLFEGEGASSFDKVDLRCSQNYSWANENKDQDTFIHECFSRDSQGAMGEHYTRSRYYHLFLNGQYWGLYMTQERGGEDFAETYNGGAADNYDVIKTSRNGGSYVTDVNEGARDAWEALRVLAVEGFGSGHEANYYKAMGCNADGSRNPDYPVYLNPTNLMVFILSMHYACDSDSPWTVWEKRPNNVYAIRDRVDNGDVRHDGFFFLRHDSEHSLGLKIDKALVYSQYNNDPTMYGVTDCDMSFAKFTPAMLHNRLCENPAYRRAFADVFYKHCLKVGGAMTLPVAKARFQKRMAEINGAIVGECARWSMDVNTCNRDKWLSVCNDNCVAGFIELRMPEMLAQYRAKGWYPSIDAATAVDSHGNPVADGARFEEDELIYLTGGEQGTVYYTTDGSDPRAADDSVAPSAQVYTEGLSVPAAGLTLKMRVRSGSGEWSALDGVAVKGSHSASAAEALRIAAVMSSAPGGDAEDFLILTNITDATISLAQVKLVAWNAKKKSEADPSLVMTFAADRELAPNAALMLTAADFGPDQKLTNSDVGLRLYDLSETDPALFQGAFVSADWFGGICDEKGAYFVAKEFGAVVKDVAQWRPSETWVERNLRFYEIEGVPAEGDDGPGEYFVLTNLSDTIELDLTGLKVVIGKKSDIIEGGDSAAKCIVTLSEGTVAAHSTVKFTQADYKWTKITNGELIMKIFDGEGSLVQYGELDQNDFPRYKAGEKVLRAISFEREIASSDWVEVDPPQGPKIESDGFIFYLTGVFTESAVIAPTGTSCYVVLDSATVPGLTFSGANTFTIIASNENKIASLAASRATVVVEGEDTFQLEGEGTLMSVSNLIVKAGSLVIKSTGIPTTKTPVVNVLGSVEQTGGVIDLDLDVATENQIYGIYVANKDMHATFSGGTLTAKVGGWKSAAIYGNKGSVDPTFSGEIAVTAELTGPEARFVNAEGHIVFAGGTFAVSMPDSYATLTNARVFKATKSIQICGGTFNVAVPAAGSEIFSADREIVVKGGVLALEAADDCLSATGDIVVSNGIVHAFSSAGDALDSNGSAFFEGGQVFAFTTSPNHDAIDVDPILTEESSGTHEIIVNAGATVIAVGGDQENFHRPDAGSTATYYAQKGLSSSEKYVEITGTVEWPTIRKTTTLSTSWKDRHAPTFTLIAAMPGYDGQSYEETSTKLTDRFADAKKLNENISGVFVRTVRTILATRGFMLMLK